MFFLQVGKHNLTYIIRFSSYLPSVSLVVPVSIDCMVDGFLIGVSVALNPVAGYVLGVANCLEVSGVL